MELPQCVIVSFPHVNKQICLTATELTPAQQTHSQHHQPLLKLKPAGAYLALLIVVLFLGLQAPSAAPLLQGLLDLRCQGARESLPLFQVLD